MFPSFSFLFFFVLFSTPSFLFFLLFFFWFVVFMFFCFCFLFFSFLFFLFFNLSCSCYSFNFFFLFWLFLLFDCSTAYDFAVRAKSFVVSRVCASKTLSKYPSVAMMMTSPSCNGTVATSESRGESYSKSDGITSAGATKS